LFGREKGEGILTVGVFTMSLLPLWSFFTFPSNTQLSTGVRADILTHHKPHAQQ